MKCIYTYLLPLLLFVSFTSKGQTEIEPSSNKYNQPHRPQFHFSPEANWMNDPNGMVYYAGEYHLFYQYYPDSIVWGPMHWAHAISKDLLQWQHLPIALYPDSLGYIFSGSAVVDWNNSSGFGIDGQPPLVAIFTYHNMAGEKAGKIDFQNQGIAYSNDKGRTWVKYKNNPVIHNPGIRDFRDPKVSWHSNSNQWIMTLAAQNQVQFWGSKDLKNWTYLSSFGKEWGTHAGVWECPDLFQMPVQGSAEKKWVLLLSINPGGLNGGSATQYFVGKFNGVNFVPDKTFAAAVANEKAVWLDNGRDNYAGVTWSDVPKNDGRRIFLGWMSNWDYATTVPTKVWRSAMTLPRELTLINTASGYRIAANPVNELKKLRIDSVSFYKHTFAGTLDISAKQRFSPSQSEMILEFKKPKSGIFKIQLSNNKGEYYEVGYNANDNQFFSDRTHAGDTSFSPKFAAKIHTAARLSSDKMVKMHLFFDAASMELFADNGKNCMTEIYFPAEDFNHLQLIADGITINNIKGERWNLKSIF